MSFPIIISNVIVTNITNYNISNVDNITFFQSLLKHQQDSYNTIITVLTISFGLIIGVNLLINIIRDRKEVRSIVKDELNKYLKKEKPIENLIDIIIKDKFLDVNNKFIELEKEITRIITFVLFNTSNYYLSLDWAIKCLDLSIESKDDKMILIIVNFIIEILKKIQISKLKYTEFNEESLNNIPEILKEKKEEISNIIISIKQIDK